jgi:hypothetical protein
MLEGVIQNESCRTQVLTRPFCCCYPVPVSDYGGFTKQFIRELDRLVSTCSSVG